MLDVVKPNMKGTKLMIKIIWLNFFVYYCIFGVVPYIEIDKISRFKIRSIVEISLLGF